MVEQRVEDEVQERIASCVRGYHIYNKKMDSSSWGNNSAVLVRVTVMLRSLCA